MKTTASTTTLFQPIYSLAHRRTIALEALSSLAVAQETVQPDQETGHLQQVVQNFKQISTPHPCWLFLNVEPQRLLQPAWAQAFSKEVRAAGLEPRQVVLAIREHALEVNQTLLQHIDLLKQQGFLVMIDDFDVGHSNLDKVCQLEPQFVKLNRQMLQASLTQPRTRRLLGRLVRLLHEMGALVIEEGIETEADVLAALASGCDLVQGSFVATAQAQPEPDEVITPRIDARWDELMARDLLKRKLTRRQVELSRQSFVQSAISLIQGTPFDLAAQPMLALPDVTRCFLLDSEGRQLGSSLYNRALEASANSPFAPLLDTTGAVWSRRSYFQHAVDQPGTLYMSEPYLSITDTQPCVTLSLAIEVDDALQVLCADVLVARRG